METQLSERKGLKVNLIKLITQLKGDVPLGYIIYIHTH